MRGHILARFRKMNQNLPENQFEQMISQRDELRNEGEQIQQQHCYNTRIEDGRVLH